MPLKKMIDADKICVNLMFLRESASAFRRYRCQSVVLPVLKIGTRMTRKGRICTDFFCVIRGLCVACGLCVPIFIDYAVSAGRVA